MRSLKPMDQTEGSKIKLEPGAGPSVNVPDGPRNTPAPFAFALRPAGPPKTPFRPPSGENGSLFERPAATISWPDAPPFPRALFAPPAAADDPSRLAAPAPADAALPRAFAAPADPIAPHGRPGATREIIPGDMRRAPKREKPSSGKGNSSNGSNTLGGAPSMPAATTNNTTRPPQGLVFAAPAASSSNASRTQLPARLSARPPPPPRSPPPPPPPFPPPPFPPPPSPAPPSTYGVALTQLLSEECQRRGFNPVITTRETRTGLWTAAAALKDRAVTTDGGLYRSERGARQAVARQALEVVRAWPIPAPSAQPRLERDRGKHPRRMSGGGSGGGGGGGQVKREERDDRGRMRDIPAAANNRRVGSSARESYRRGRQSAASNARPMDEISARGNSRARQPARDNNTRTMAMEMPDASHPRGMEIPGNTLEQMQQMMLRSANLPAGTDAARLFIEGMVAGARATGFFEQALASATTAPSGSSTRRRDRSRSPGRPGFGPTGAAAPSGRGHYRARSPLRMMEMGTASVEGPGLAAWASGSVGSSAHQPALGGQGMEGDDQHPHPPPPSRQTSMNEFQGPTGFAPWPGSGNTPASNTNISGSDFGNPVPYRQQQQQKNQSDSRPRTSQPGSRHGAAEQRGVRHGTEQQAGTTRGTEQQLQQQQGSARPGAPRRGAGRAQARRQRHPDLYPPEYEDLDAAPMGEWEHDRFRP